MFARDPNLARVRASGEFVQFMAELKPRYEAMDNKPSRDREGVWDGAARHQR